MSRKLASIQEIISLEPIEDADGDLNKAGTLYMIAGCRFFCFWKQIWIWVTLLWFIRDYSATTVNISEKPVVSSISITDSLTL